MSKNASNNNIPMIEAGSGKLNVNCKTVPLKRKTKRISRRSEEHTSELQSRPQLVCRLLLEKKKKKAHRSRRGPFFAVRVLVKQGVKIPAGLLLPRGSRGDDADALVLVAMHVPVHVLLHVKL